MDPAPRRHAHLTYVLERVDTTHCKSRMCTLYDNTDANAQAGNSLLPAHIHLPHLPMLAVTEQRLARESHGRLSHLNPYGFHNLRQAVLPPPLLAPGPFYASCAPGLFIITYHHDDS